MRIGAGALAGGIFGVVGTLCFLVAFSTDYWFVAKENCGSYLHLKDTNRTKILLHHEGFFQRCTFQVESSTQAVLAAFFTNHPENKMCFNGYLFPLPVALGDVPNPIYDATAVFRGFWTVLIVVGLISAVFGGLLLLCGVPFISKKLHRLGGAFLMTAGCLFLFMLLLFVLWMELVDVKRYILMERVEDCADAEVSIFYGLSFMVAAAGVPLELLSGLLFLMVGRSLSANK